MKKKTVIILIVVLLLIAGGATAVYFVLQNRKAESEELVYVTEIADLNGGYNLNDSRYMGVVESQEVKGVNRDSNKTVKELYVKVEDEVKEGDVLFEYDTEEMELQLRQLELELTSIYNNISTMNQQIATLSDEKKQVPPEEQLSYTAQIQNLQAQINQANYDASAKQLEIDRQKLSMENTKVYAPMDGIIKTINENNSTNPDSSNNYYDGNSNSDSSTDNAYITIMAKGDYRIKATASELNVRNMMEGQSMIVRSRVDNSCWSGTITKIDLEHPENNNNEYYYSPGTSATKYPFYISLDSVDGLMLGQHVYVEVDYGQGLTKEGLWLDEFYIMQEESGAYVWAEDAKGRIEKRKVELGEYDEYMMRYEILSGLTESDYIAYPENRIHEGMKTTHNFEDIVIDDSMYDDGMYDDGMYDDGMYDDGMYDDGMYDDGMYDDGMYDDGMYDDGVYDDGMIDEEMIPKEAEDGSVEEAIPDDTPVVVPYEDGGDGEVVQ